MLSHLEIKQSVYGPLKELGLSEHELTLYALSLSLGPKTIKDLAEYLHISRPNVYKVIEGLEKHGLTSFSTKKGYKKNFGVEPPTIITELLRKKRESVTAFERDLTAAMPDLLSMYRQGDMPASVELLVGEDQFVRAFDQILEQAKGQIEFFGSVEEFIGFISWSKEKEWIKKRLKQGIVMRSLLFHGADAVVLKKTDKEELRETRILQEVDACVASFHLFANKVIIWQPKTPMALLISDEYIVKMFRNIFYGYWNKAE